MGHDVGRANLTRDEVAALVGVTTRTVYNWIRQGLLTPINDEGEPLFERAQVLRLEEARKESGGLDTKHALVNLRYRVERLENDMRVVRAILDLRRAPLRPDMEATQSLAEAALAVVMKKRDLTLDDIELWARTLSQIDDTTLDVMEEHTQTSGLWDLFYRLCTHLERTLSSMDQFDTSLSLQKLHAQVDYSRCRLRESVLIHLARRGAPLVEIHRAQFGTEPNPKLALFDELASK